MRFTSFMSPKNPIKQGKNAKVAKSTRVCPPTGATSKNVKNRQKSVKNIFDTFLSIVQKSLWRGGNKNGVSNFRRSIGHFSFVRSNCWGPVTSENKCVWAPNPCILRSFGLKMRQKQVRELFRKVCQTCFCAKIAVCRRDF